MKILLIFFSNQRKQFDLVAIKVLLKTRIGTLERVTEQIGTKFRDVIS